MDGTEISCAIQRIQRMEQLFDFVSEAAQAPGNNLTSSSVQQAIQTLDAYYFGGEWLHDYELDERNLLPADLKRGVLSQDGLYNLLCSIQEDKNAASETL